MERGQPDSPPLPPPPHPYGAIRAPEARMKASLHPGREDGYGVSHGGTAVGNAEKGRELVGGREEGR